MNIASTASPSSTTADIIAETNAASATTTPLSAVTVSGVDTGFTPSKQDIGSLTKKLGYTFGIRGKGDQE